MYSFQNEDYQAELLLTEEISRRLFANKIGHSGGKKGGLKVLMISSSGENVLSVATSPLVQKIYAADINKAELHLAELRRTSAIFLDVENQLNLLGANPKIKINDEKGREQREHLYQNLREHLPQETRDYWDERKEQIRFGLQHVGRNEQVNHQYQLELQKFDLDPINKPNETLSHYGWKQAMESVLEVSRYFNIIQYPPDAVAALLEKMGCAWRGREKIKGFEENIASKKILPKDNYFLTTVFNNYYAFGADNEKGLPLFLQSGGSDDLKRLGVGPERIEFVEGDVFKKVKEISLRDGLFDIISISNIPDWLSWDEFSVHATTIKSCLKPGGALLGRMALEKLSMLSLFQTVGFEVSTEFNQKLKEVERSSWWTQIVAGFAPQQTNESSNVLQE
eukprot:TRINITY_DN2304_c0_g1_i1.p1 TRINITY_DN2304_c0_g1~~TRINITY_DN2304_c0_g1_i1.p1  ORF type:complete len:395 (-),score=92.45 TRINITY_DN2304_c0_g1_i1:92-1276(-)